MTKIPGELYYSCRGCFLQHKHGNLAGNLTKHHRLSSGDRATFKPALDSSPLTNFNIHYVHYYFCFRYGGVHLHN